MSYFDIQYQVWVIVSRRNSGNYMRKSGVFVGPIFRSPILYKTKHSLVWTKLKMTNNGHFKQTDFDLNVKTLLGQIKVTVLKMCQKIKTGTGKSVFYPRKCNSPIL